VYNEHFSFTRQGSVDWHYSGEVENIYIILWQIYSGSYVTNFIEMTRILYKI